MSTDETSESQSSAIEETNSQYEKIKAKTSNYLKRLRNLATIDHLTGHAGLEKSRAMAEANAEALMREAYGDAYKRDDDVQYNIESPQNHYHYPPQSQESPQRKAMGPLTKLALAAGLLAAGGAGVHWGVPLIQRLLDRPEASDSVEWQGGFYRPPSE